MKTKKDKTHKTKKFAKVAESWTCVFAIWLCNVPTAVTNFQTARWPLLWRISPQQEVYFERSTLHVSVPYIVQSDVLRDFHPSAVHIHSS